LFNYVDKLNFVELKLCLIYPILRSWIVNYSEISSVQQPL